MIPEIGHFALILAFALALAAAPTLLVAAHAGDGALAALGRRAVLVVAALVFLSFASLVYAYAVSDFSVVNVFQNSHSAKPLIFKITGAWGNHEGSMLLWALILALFAAALAGEWRAAPFDLHARALGVQALIAAAFLAFILFTSNPFERLFPTPADGRGLNPLLQDFGLAVHPPFLYLGYVGFSVPFAFAVAALMRGRADSVWARLVRPWALAAWTFLTVGIALGAWWAYYELGWGGWWAWDPVENASFMPWLAGVALIHSLRVVERRDALKAWAVLLAIATFSLSLVGTFLVRSGVLTSVHAFAVDPERGVFILAILAVATGGALILYALRAHALTPGGAFAPASRETLLIVNNAVICAATATVFLGTFYPLFVELAGGGRISVGAPYFNAVFTPLALLTLALAAAGTLTPWKRAELRAVARALWPAMIAALAAFLVAVVIADRARFAGAGAVALAAWLGAASLLDVARRAGFPRVSAVTALRRLAGLPRSALGANLAHFGLGLFALGAAGAGVWKQETIAVLAAGENVAFAGRAVTLESVSPAPGPNYEAERAVLRVERKGRTFTLEAERRYYPVRGMQTTEAGIRSLGTADFYATIGEATADGRRPLRLSFFPLVGCLWWGAALAALGGALALSDRGRLLAARPAPAPAEAAPS